MSSSSSVRPRPPTLSGRLAEIVRHYWDLGFISFGGPGVHVVILRKRFVENIKWLDKTTFQDLFSLGNALPGPGSTQLAFSIAIARGGALAGLIGFLIWSIPGAVAMGTLGFGVKNIPNTLPPIVYGLLTGLNAAAVGLIAVAAYQLSSNAITDSVTRLIVLGSASFGICYHAPWMYPTLVAAGGLLTLAFDYRHQIVRYLKRRLPSRRRNEPVQNQPIELDVFTPGLDKDVEGPEPEPAAIANPPNEGLRYRGGQEDRQTSQADAQSEENEYAHIITPSPWLAWPLGALVLALVVTMVILRGKLTAPSRALSFFTNMMIAGTIIFGGGPVVIPLLRGYTVDNGWINSRDFLLGFAILNGMPGPNFNFAVFLGALCVPSRPALGAVLGYLGIFSPGILLKLALLPLYKKWRSYGIARSILRGLNAAAAGLVYTAVYSLFLVGYIYKPASGSDVSGGGSSQSGSLTADPWWAVVAAGAFVSGHNFGFQPFLIIAAGAVAGIVWYGVQTAQ